MTKLMVCVKEISGGKLEIGVFEEGSEAADGTKAERGYLNKLTVGIGVVMEEISEMEGLIESGMDLDNPYSELAKRVRERFQRKG